MSMKMFYHTEHKVLQNSKITGRTQNTSESILQILVKTYPIEIPHRYHTVWCSQVLSHLCFILVTYINLPLMSSTEDFFLYTVLFS